LKKIVRIFSGALKMWASNAVTPNFYTNANKGFLTADGATL